LRRGAAALYAESVSRLHACLVDVYDTLLTCDFAPRWAELPAMAGVPADAWREEFPRLAVGLGTGQVSTAAVFGQVLRACGVEPRDGLVRRLVDRDRELLLAHARLFDDAIPFLQELRSRGIRIAIVSNCDQKTRDLLVEVGVAALADTLVLSCEVGTLKPSPEIFQVALGRLGASPEAALFVDDQAAYCAGSAELGITAVQIVRDQGSGNEGAAGGQATAPGTTVVRSLPDVAAMFPK
jgi:putative hydrolase of the HAD superfamily